jgi:hypothetical protein
MLISVQEDNKSIKLRYSISVDPKRKEFFDFETKIKKVITIAYLMQKRKSFQVKDSTKKG